MKKTHLHYAGYLQLPDFERSVIEGCIVKTCKFYFNQGHSISVSISKTFNDSPFYITLVTNIIRKNAEMKALFDARTYVSRRSRSWVR